jgi:hypothetical protein
VIREKKEKSPVYKYEMFTKDEHNKSLRKFKKLFPSSFENNVTNQVYEFGFVIFYCEQKKTLGEEQIVKKSTCLSENQNH